MYFTRMGFWRISEVCLLIILTEMQRACVRAKVAD